MAGGVAGWQGVGRGARTTTRRRGNPGRVKGPEGTETWNVCLYGAPVLLLEWQPPMQTTQLCREQERDKSTLAWELGSPQRVMFTLSCSWKKTYPERGRLTDF